MGSTVSEYGQPEGQGGFAQVCGFCARRNSKTVAKKLVSKTTGTTGTRSGAKDFVEPFIKNKEPKKLSSILRSSGLNANAGTFVPRSVAVSTAAERRGNQQAPPEVRSVIQTSKYRNLLGKTRAPGSRSNDDSSPIVSGPVTAEAGSKDVVDVRNLGQMWASTFQATESRPQVAEDNMKRLKQAWSAACKDSVPPRKATATRDDIEVERLSVDMDLSEPFAWSEDESSIPQRTLRGGRHFSAHKHFDPQRRKTAPSRSYIMQDLSAELDHVVAMFLHRLHVFNDRGIDSVSKRYVLGMTDCVRRAHQLKLKCLIIATDLDAATTNPTLDERVREVLAFAYQNQIEVIFALDRPGLGRAFGKSMGISIIGVLDTRGANALYGQAVALARKLRASWLAKHEEKCTKAAHARSEARKWLNT